MTGVQGRKFHTLGNPQATTNTRTIPNGTDRTKKTFEVRVGCRQGSSTIQVMKVVLRVRMSQKVV